MIRRVTPRKVELGYLRINRNAKKNVLNVLETNRLSYGTYTRRFEQRFAALHGCGHAVFCNSGTSALQIALAALRELYRWKDGDQVLVPALTFIATANIVIQNGLRPVFVDVDPLTYNLDPSQIERHVTSRTRAVIPVHLFGQPCDMDPILRIARSHRLRVLEDSCETMFCRYKGRPVGSFGDAACFSTYVAHLLVTGVGGLVTTRSDRLQRLCRSIMAHGRDPRYLSIDDDDRAHGRALESIVSRRFRFVRMGYSYRATEMEAALGLAALGSRRAIIRRRRANARLLTRLLRPFEENLQLPTVLKGAEHSFMMFPLTLRDGINREPLLNFLESRGIETRTLMPLLNQPFYVRQFGNLERRYPVAHRLNRQGFYIPCHQGLSLQDLRYVASVFSEYFSRAGRRRA